MTIYEKYTELIENAELLRDMYPGGCAGYIRMTESIIRMIKTQESLPESCKNEKYTPKKEK